MASNCVKLLGCISAYAIQAPNCDSEIHERGTDCARNRIRGDYQVTGIYFGFSTDKAMRHAPHSLAYGPLTLSLVLVYGTSVTQRYIPG